MNKNYALNSNVTKVSSIKEMLDLAVKEAGDKNAFEYRDEANHNKIIEVTYKEFVRDTDELGTALASLGMADKHIAMIGENSYKWLTVYLTVLKSTGVFVPIDRELPCKDIINVLKHSDSEVLFYSEKYEKWIQEIKANVPNIKFFIGLNRHENDGNILSYDIFKQTGKSVLEQGSKIYTDLKDDENKLKLLVYTSGTTGAPKGVMLTEHNLISVVYYGLQVADIGKKCLSVLPYHHTYEAVAGILVELHKHSTICINDSLKNVLKNLQLFKPDFIYLVPAFTEVFYKNIWNNAQKTGKDKMLKKMIPISNGLRATGIDLRAKLFKSIHEAFGGNLKEIICGGAPIRPEIGKFFNDIGITLLNGYGITECSPLVSVNRLKFNDSMQSGISASPPQTVRAWHRLLRQESSSAAEQRLREIRPSDRHGSCQPAEYVSDLRRRFCRQDAPADGLYQPSRRGGRSVVHRRFRHDLEGCGGRLPGIAPKNNQQRGSDERTSWLSREWKLVYNGIPSEMTLSA